MKKRLRDNSKEAVERERCEVSKTVLFFGDDQAMLEFAEYAKALEQAGMSVIKVTSKDEACGVVTPPDVLVACIGALRGAPVDPNSCGALIVARAFLNKFLGLKRVALLVEGQAACSLGGPYARNSSGRVKMFDAGRKSAIAFAQEILQGG